VQIDTAVSRRERHPPAGARDIHSRYWAAQRLAGGSTNRGWADCRLADHECRHGRLAFDRSAPCGCWPEEGAVARALPEAGSRSKRPESEQAAA
jgi:hypothetical protein